METETAGIGHNRPPPFEDLSLKGDEYMKGASTLMKEHPPLITDKEVGEKLGGFLRQLKDLFKRADEERKAENKPWDDKIKANNEKWKGLKDKLTLAIDYTQKKVDAHLSYLNEQRRKAEAEALEKQRQLEEEAAKKKREAEELQRQAEAGELKGSNADPIQAQLDAEAAADAAKDAGKEANKLKGNATVGSSFALGGVSRGVAQRTYYHAKIEKPKATLAFFAFFRDPTRSAS